MLTTNIALVHKYILVILNMWVKIHSGYTDVFTLHLKAIDISSSTFMYSVFTYYSETGSEIVVSTVLECPR